MVLGAILRVADALDRDHRQRVHAVTAFVERGRVRLAVDAEGDLFLESWSLRNRSDMFREVFNRKVVLQSSSLSAADAD
jgi:exopolyphosphatase/guanosine-5'-triphosphate,3'-diphosphate pyrophosphatase